MMEDRYIPESESESVRTPEARYAYYRRCQVFRKNGEQCKAPAEKDSHICYAHAGQQAMTLRRKLQLMVVLAEVARRMRERGKPEFEVADIFMDFNAIQMTLPVMAQALIDGRIDCKTAGRLAVGLQTAAKLLRMMRRKGRQENRVSPQISADERRLDKPGEKAHLTTEARRHKEQPNAAKTWATNRREETLMAFVPKFPAFADIRSSAHDPPGWARAA